MTKSIKQTAERFGVGPHTVLHWIAKGDLHAINVARTAGGKPHWRITEDAITAFELLRSASPPEVPRPRRRRKSDDSVIKFY